MYKAITAAIVACAVIALCGYTPLNYDALNEVAGAAALRAVSSAEPDTQNVFYNTSDFSQSYWTKTAVTQGDSISSPLGGMAQYYYGNIDGSSHRVARDQTGITFTADNVASIFVKSDLLSGRVFRISIWDNTGEPFPYHHEVTFTASESGVFTVTASNQADGSGVIDEGSGFYRLWVYVDGATRGIVDHPMRVYFYFSQDGAYTSGAYIDGAQLEQISGRRSPGDYVEGYTP